MNAKTTEAAGVGMSVADAMALIEREADKANESRLSDDYTHVNDCVRMRAEALAALAALQARLLAADELREALGAGLRIGGAYGQELHFYGQAFTTLDAALAAYDKAGTNEH